MTVAQQHRTAVLDANPALVLALALHHQPPHQVPPLARRLLTSTTLQDCLGASNVPVSFTNSAVFSALAQPYNLRLAYIPAVIVLPTTMQHIIDAVLCAGKSNVKVQAKSGGHSYASFSSGGQNGAMVIDLESFQQITVGAGGIAQTGPGVRLGDMALGIFNQSQRALPHGT